MLKGKKEEIHMKSKLIAGIIVTMFLVTMVFSGVSVRATVQTIRVGVVGPKGMVQWESQIGGAQIALPKAEALLGTDYAIELVEIDEAAYPVVNPAQAYINMLTALSTPPGLDFIVGGFRTECVYGMMNAMHNYYLANNGTGNKQPVWYISGAATDALMNPVLRPYLFRVAPVNSTSLVATLIAFLAGWVLPHKLIPIYGLPVKTYIVAENLVWCDIMPTLLQYYLNNNTGVYPLCDFVGVARPAWDETDFSALLSDIESKKARLVIHIFSDVTGVFFIRQWGKRQISAVPVGINMLSQMSEIWWGTAARCEYETLLAYVGTPTPISQAWGTSETTDFWDDFVNLKGHPPIYTAFGTHDSVMAFSEFLKYNATSWPMNYSAYVPILEQTVRRGLLGTFKFTSNHDVYSVDIGPTWSPPYYVRPQIVQWQTYKKDPMEVVWPRDQVYSKKYKIPPWMYDKAETDWYGALDLQTGQPTIGPDGLVDVGDVFYAAFRWQQAPYPYLEADMDGNNFINMFDISTIVSDYGYNAGKPENYGQWPLP